MSKKSERFTKIVVKKPGSSLVNGITSANLGFPDFKEAKIQHNSYIDCLNDCGAEVIIMEADEQYPDSVFIEDTAIVTGKFAIITRPYPLSRQTETDSVSRVLFDLFEEIEQIKAPGTLEGGDVLQIDNKFFIGISGRTNKNGAEQLVEIVGKFGYQGFKIPMQNLLHLKTGVSYLGNNTILVGKELVGENLFKPYESIIVDDEESYAANCIRVNDFVVFPRGYPKTLQKLTNAGFTTKELEMSEFRKLDGGLSCLSLRF